MSDVPRPALPARQLTSDATRVKGGRTSEKENGRGQGRTRSRLVEDQHHTSAVWLPPTHDAQPILLNGSPASASHVHCPRLGHRANQLLRERVLSICQSTICQLLGCPQDQSYCLLREAAKPCHMDELHLMKQLNSLTDQPNATTRPTVRTQWLQCGLRP